MTAIHDKEVERGVGEQGTEMNRIPTHASGKSHGRKQSGGLFRSITGQSGVFSERRRSMYHESESDDEYDGPIVSKAETWALMPEVKELQDRNNREGHPGRKLGVTWNNLVCFSLHSTATTNTNEYHRQSKELPAAA